MVEYGRSLDDTFGALSDPVRRDILQRVSTSTLNISDIAKPYQISFAAISKHLKVLEEAGLITKRRHGKEQLVQIAPAALTSVAAFIEPFRHQWQGYVSPAEDER